MTTPRETGTNKDDRPGESDDHPTSEGTSTTESAPAVNEPLVTDEPVAEPVAASRAEERPRSAEPAETGPGWATRDEPTRSVSGSDTTTVLPSAARRSSSRRPPPAAARPGTRPLAARSRRARLTLRRVDPWSVFLFSLVASVFVGLALVVAVAVMYAVLGSLGVTESLNELYAEVTGGDLRTDALITSNRIIGGAAVLAAVNVVFLTLLATLGALLYNLCASFTGGLELTFGERD